MKNSVMARRNFDCAGGFGEKPKPTVIVRMREGCQEIPTYDMMLGASPYHTLCAIWCISGYHLQLALRSLARGVFS
jgi:hypothetical protein